MSTTRKIEGIANLTDNDEITLSIEPNTSPVHIYKEPATLVIGGKCLTEEEHEAEFQRRARAMLDRIHRQMSCLVSSTVMDEFLETAADYGIKLTP
jgi:RNase H-fold protein (predicted Holliday junction resolvase)